MDRLSTAGTQPGCLLYCFPLWWGQVGCLGLHGARWSCSHGPQAVWGQAPLPFLDFWKQGSLLGSAGELAPRGGSMSLPVLSSPSLIASFLKLHDTIHAGLWDVIIEVQGRSSYSVPSWPSVSQIY